MASVSDSTQFPCITLTKLAGGFLAVWYDGTKLTFVNSTPSTHKKVAEVAARLFAKEKNLPFLENTVLQFVKPILLVYIEKRAKWCPARANAEKHALMEIFAGDKMIAANYDDAVVNAKYIASMIGGQFLFHPSIVHHQNKNS